MPEWTERNHKTMTKWQCNNAKQGTNLVTKFTTITVTQVQGPYSQNFFTQIHKIFVTLTWILELISHQK